MSKLAMSLASLALAGCASTNGWRAMRIDGSSQARFEESVALMQQAMPATRSQLFAMALQDIWITGTVRFAGEDRYGAQDYFEQLDGLDYAQIIGLADASGPSTMQQYTSSRQQRALGDIHKSFAPAADQGFREGPQHHPAASNPWREIQADFEARYGN